MQLETDVIYIIQATNDFNVECDYIDEFLVPLNREILAEAIMNCKLVSKTKPTRSCSCQIFLSLNG